MAANKRLQEQVAKRRTEVRLRHAGMVAHGEPSAVAVAKLAAEYEVTAATIYFDLRGGRKARRTKP